MQSYTYITIRSHLLQNRSPTRFDLRGKSTADKPFASIRDGFSHYKASEFSFIQGEAVGVDEAAKIVSVQSAGTPTNASIQYSSLIVATGTTSTSPFWSLHGDYKLTIAAFEDMHKRLPNAETILIAGGGPAGIETAGEIAYLYKPKDMTILSGSARLLPRLKNTSVAKAAEGRHASLNVKTVHVRVTSSTELEDGRTSVKLSDGSTKTIDIYLDATGGTPNTSFFPAGWLGDSKRVVTDVSTLHATKAPAGVYGIGRRSILLQRQCLGCVVRCSSAGLFNLVGFTCSRK